MKSSSKKYVYNGEVRWNEMENDERVRVGVCRGTFEKMSEKQRATYGSCVRICVSGISWIFFSFFLLKIHSDRSFLSLVRYKCSYYVTYVGNFDEYDVKKWWFCQASLNRQYRQVYRNYRCNFQIFSQTIRELWRWVEQNLSPEISYQEYCFQIFF